MSKTYAVEFWELMVDMTSFRNDSVIDYTPITFAGKFIRKMRKHKRVKNIPSIRSTIAIPKFLSARYWRKEKLDPIDYFDAAVYTTPYDDQEIAKEIAKLLLFPRKEQPKKSPTKIKVQEIQKPKSSGIDQIMDELSGAGFDDLMDIMDLGNDLEDLMEEQQDAWNFLEELLDSSDISDLSRLELLEELDSEYAIIQHYLNNRSYVDQYLQQQMSETAGSWSPQLFQPASNLGFEKQLQRYSQMPWEIATAMGIAGESQFSQYMNYLLKSSSAHTLGKTLRYLNENNIPVPQNWKDKAFEKIKNLSDYYEMLQGLQQYRPPPSGIIEKAATSDISNNLDLADKINQQFGRDHSGEIFNHFHEKAQSNTPSIQQVQDATYEDPNNRWQGLLKKAVEQEKQGIDHQELAKMASNLTNHNSHRLNPQMKRSQTLQAQKIATESMTKLQDKEQFFPQLEYLIQEGATPDFDETVQKAKEFGIDEERVSEYYKDATKVMENYISSDNRDKNKYNRLIPKIDKIPPDIMKQMMQNAVDSNNSVAMAALGAVDLNAAAQASTGMIMPDGSNAQLKLADSMDKSIGGGTNLLKQWFIHRDRLPKLLRDRLKEMMIDVLLEIGIDWANRGKGSSEEGIIPINRTRPYRPGDELDMIDIQATLDTLLMSGKTLKQITEDELMVTETSKGKTAMGVLIDISGSMSGQNLAMCAIAVVMLLGKLEEEEIAIALFESNTHKIKGFEQEVELDQVADELLDLKARGGTRASMALQWITEEFENVINSEVKILYFLSDFMLSERGEQLSNLCDPLQALDVKILATSHGSVSKPTRQTMVDMLNGHELHIKNFDTLPKQITDAISSIS